MFIYRLSRWTPENKKENSRGIAFAFKGATGDVLLTVERNQFVREDCCPTRSSERWAAARTGRFGGAETIRTGPVQVVGDGISICEGEMMIFEWRGCWSRPDLYATESLHELGERKMYIFMLLNSQALSPLD